MAPRARARLERPADRARVGRRGSGVRPIGDGIRWGSVAVEEGQGSAWQRRDGSATDHRSVRASEPVAEGAELRARTAQRLGFADRVEAATATTRRPPGTWWEIGTG
jgi:hypothetical protein